MTAPSIGLIFDVDGVIADTETVNAHASIQAFVDILDLHGVQRADFEAGLGRGAEAYVRAAANVHGQELTNEQTAALVTRRQENFLRMLKDSPLPPFPGVMKLITDAMHDPEMSLAIATSSTREKSESALTSAGIPYTQMVYINGDLVTHKKPDPELFLLASDAMGLSPDSCVVIEDAPNGVAAAHAAGCRCIAVTNSVSADALADADRIVDSLTEIALSDIRAMIQMIP